MALRNPRDRVTLERLPYDLMLSIIQHLELRDVRALQLTRKSIHHIVMTRPVYRHLAQDLLRRCRAMPLTGFQRLLELPTEQLIRTVNKAALLEHSWLTRTPRPATSAYFSRSPLSSQAQDEKSGKGKGKETACQNKGWYKIVSTPPDEKLDWLSPITASYTLCSTKSGKVICWDVFRDRSLAEWHAGNGWELWKCRVEFDARSVYFTMARHLSGSHDSNRMAFKIMKISFDLPSGSPPGQPAELVPTFSHIRTFNTMGMVMNIFLLDPASRLLSGFVLLMSSDTVGLYVLLDWDKEEYVFVDTKIKCSHEHNWSCILHDQTIIIHSEGPMAAVQYYYPLSLLRHFSTPSDPSPQFNPVIGATLPPARVASRKFSFPILPPLSYRPAFLSSRPYSFQQVPGVVFVPVGSQSGSDQQLTHPHVLHLPSALHAPYGSETNVPNPFTLPMWYPECAHFVRQWWPTLPGVPRLSSTVVLSAQHDPVSHRTKYILSQHYFRVPLDGGSPPPPPAPPSRASRYGEVPYATRGVQRIDGDALMRMWYVSTPFEVVSVMEDLDVADPDDPLGGRLPHARPLLAVDFGHAVWIEAIPDEQDDAADAAEGEEGFVEGEDDRERRLRFVSFPSVYLGGDDEQVRYSSIGARGVMAPVRRGLGVEDQWFPMEGDVKTLEIPDELDLKDVETINIDQSQGAIILSLKGGKIFILCYE
ncbi:hypothetical protein DENSPDRAFT_843502 [Dentipellis sp. KUC8613]|nr:hypothetical protein DENSPDRAFT_843502 [Dentipellis sp. KUC8613]